MEFDAFEFRWHFIYRAALHLCWQVATNKSPTRAEFPSLHMTSPSLRSDARPNQDISSLGPLLHPFFAHQEI